MAIGDKIYNLEINDSEFEREGWKNARYKGSKLKAATINKFSKGDISFAKQPVIEQYSKTVYVFNQARHSFDADDPSNFSQIEPGINKDDYHYDYFDYLVKNDLALFNSCSVKFFNNDNNSFVKPFYTVGHNKGKFQPASAFFPSASTSSDFYSEIDNSRITAQISNNGRLYINPNVEEWFIAQTGATGSQGSLNATSDQTVAITITHTGNGNGSDINSLSGYILGLSKEINNDNPYFIAFNQGLQGIGNLKEKNLLKAFDVRELQYSGSNIHDFSETSILKIKTEGKDNGNFTTTYSTANEQDAIIFKRINSNNVIHLDFNKDIEAPAGTGNGGVIIPNNLHPKIKEQLNVYLSNAGLGAEGGSSANFNLGGIVAKQKDLTITSPTIIDDTENIMEQENYEVKLIVEEIGGETPTVGNENLDGYGGPDPNNPHTPDSDPQTGIVGGNN